MSLNDRLLRGSISTKLLGINILVCVVFVLIGLAVFFSFRNMNNIMSETVTNNISEVTTNALTERELSFILSDTNLLLGRFFEDSDFLMNEGNRLLTFTLVQVSRNKGRALEEPLQMFAQSLGLVLQQCAVINDTLAEFHHTSSEIQLLLNRLEINISQKLVKLAYDGQDTTGIEHISDLVAGYHHNWLEVTKLYAESWPEQFYQSPSDVDREVVPLVEGMIQRVQPLVSDQSAVAAQGGQLIGLVEKYLLILIKLHDEMQGLRTYTTSLDGTKQEIANVMEQLDRNVHQAVQLTVSKLDRNFQDTGLIALLLSIIIAIGVGLFTSLLFRKIIKNPMETIREGIENVSVNSLKPQINLGRNDEWRLIENALNSMAAKVAASHQQLKQNQEQLESKVALRTSELNSSKDKAEAANVAKSEFLARMSHEIRTPLNAVTGLTNVVLKSELTEQQRDYLSKIQLASNNLLEVVNDILDFSKVEAGRLELSHNPFDLDQVLEQMADLFSTRVASKDLELVFSVNQDLPRQLIGDGPRLIQILTNLLENAVKFTAAGEIALIVEQQKDTSIPEQQILLEFSVKDSGVGIAEQELPLVFEPFTRADSYLIRKQEGSGLGLSICRRLVELMGGKIAVKSTPGQGSTFTFTVQMEKHSAENIRVSFPPDLHGLKTLVVDDSDTVREGLSSLLSSFTFDVMAVESGVRAIETLQEAAETGQPVDLVLLDWKMEGMDGLETARTIRNLTELPFSPIIVMVTAYGQELLKSSLNTDVIDGLLLKPVKPSGLFNTVMELFGRGVPVAPVSKKSTDDSSHFSGKRVLVVEDSDLNREVAEALLQGIGLEVQTAENGQLALEMVVGSTRGFDAVLMDIQMPVMDGYTATREIRNSNSPWSEVPIIALTAHALKGEKEKCLAVGMDDYLAKPIDEQQLDLVLNRWLFKKRTEDDLSGSDLETRHDKVSTGPMVLNVPAVLQRMGGRQDLVLKALGKFRAECHQVHEIIGESLTAGDKETAQSKAHAMIGNAATVGAEALARTARTLEQDIKDDVSELENSLNRFNKELIEAHKAIDDFLEKEAREE